MKIYQSFNENLTLNNKKYYIFEIETIVSFILSLLFDPKNMEEIF
jgi:hypothetical protein